MQKYIIQKYKNANIQKYKNAKTKKRPKYINTKVQK